MSLRFKLSLSSVLLRVDFILRQDGCQQLLATPNFLTGPVETMPLFNNPRRSFRVEPLIVSDDPIPRALGCQSGHIKSCETERKTKVVSPNTIKVLNPEDGEKDAEQSKERKERYPHVELWGTP